MNKLVLLGGGGHCRSVIDSIDKEIYEIVGILDPNIPKGNVVLGIPILGDDDEMKALICKNVDYAMITAGSIGNPKIRKKLYKIAKDLGYKIPIVIDKTAIISDNIEVEEGTFIGKGAIVNTGVKLGKNCIINSGSIIEHDCHVSDFVHIAPGSTLSGMVTVGENSHIGSNSTIIQNIVIGNDTLIGAGSLVVNNIASDVVAFGSPCKVVRKNE